MPPNDGGGGGGNVPEERSFNHNAGIAAGWETRAHAANSGDVLQDGVPVNHRT